MLKVISVDYPIENDDVKNISFLGDETFLDADILILNIEMINNIIQNSFYKIREYNYSISSNDSYNVICDKMAQRTDEVKKLLYAGKKIIVFLYPILNVVDSYGKVIWTNYSWTPYTREQLISYFINGSGDTVFLKNQNHILVPYYTAFKNELKYYLHFNYHNDDDKGIFLINNAGYAIGWQIRSNEGDIFFIPPPPQNCDSKKVFGILLQSLRKLYNGIIQTPEPLWVKKIKLPGEQELDDKISKKQLEIDSLFSMQSKIVQEREKLASYRHLLYEQGKELERVVINSFKLMGFSAANFVQDDLEHDLILISDEGRAIAEIEGKDKDPINVDKIDQLNRVVDEDFKENGTFAQGLLIGNPYRLLPLDERKDPFTKKVKIFAEKKTFKLLTTVELFSAVMKILENPNDDNYKKQCREKIFESSDLEIRF
jgi:hypothetical protein